MKSRLGERQRGNTAIGLIVGLVVGLGVALGIAVYLRWFALLLARPHPEDEVEEPPAGGRRPRGGATAVLVLGTGILVLFSVLPGLLLGLLS